MISPKELERLEYLPRRISLQKQMIKYCIGVDVLNFPVYIIHTILEQLVYNQFANSIVKQSKVDLKVKHYHIQHK